MRSDVNHSPLSNVQVVNQWSYVSTPPIRLQEVLQEADWLICTSFKAT